MPRYLNIDTTDKTDVTTTILIESVVYLFRLRYSYRSEWQLGIYDNDTYSSEVSDNSEAKLYGDRKLVPSQDFLKYAKYDDKLPSGNLYLYDTEDPTTEEYEVPSRYNLGQGKRFVLIYYTADEISALLEG